MQTHLKAIDVLDFLKIDFTTSHSRRTDPATSKEAATAAEKFAKSHAGIILAALREYGACTKDELANLIDLNGTQIARRLPDLFDAGLAKPTGQTRSSESGLQERVWMVV